MWRRNTLISHMHVLICWDIKHSLKARPLQRAQQHVCVCVCVCVYASAYIYICLCKSVRGCVKAEPMKCVPALFNTKEVS